jgi:hypothetical protein
MGAENIMHLFWNCLYVQEFWENLNDWLRPLFNIISKENICFGIEDELFCSVIFSAKKFIYRCKLEQTRPRIPGFKAYLKYLKHLEFSTASILTNRTSHSPCQLPIGVKGMECMAVICWKLNFKKKAHSFEVASPRGIAVSDVPLGTGDALAQPIPTLRSEGPPSHIIII